MSSTALKIFAAVSVLVAIILATVGYRMSRDYAEKADTAKQEVQQQKAEQTLAVVAVKPLGAYKAIPRDAVALVPVAVKPADPFGSIDEVVGKQPLVDIDTGAPITKRYFREGNLLARAIPPGFQAVSISVTDVLAVGGFLRPGDVVDILIFIRGAEGAEQPQSRVLLERVRVLAYLAQVIDRPEGIEDDPNAPQQRQSSTAVLAIADQDTTKLMLGASLGELRLALRGQHDEPATDAPTTALAANTVAPAGAAKPIAPTATAKAPVSASAAAAPAHPSTAAVASVPKAKLVRPEKIITSAELARLRPVPGTGNTTKVEIFRGSERSSVVTK